MKRYWPLLLILLISLTLSACTGVLSATDSAPPIGQAKEATATAVAVAAKTVARPTASTEATPGNDEAPSETASSDSAWESAADAVTITLGKAITVSGSGATVDGSTITAAGTYRLSGTLDDGQIVVNTKDKETVALVLDGVDITCLTSAPIYVMSAKTTVIALAEGTENRVADGASYDVADPEANEPNATIFSKGDLVITGNGSLMVEANYNDAIASKDELQIMGGNITVNSVGDGLRGRDNIVVKSGNITVKARADGLKSTNDEDPEKGFITVEGGSLNITAGEDGLQAETKVAIGGGEIKITSGGGSANSSSQSTWGNWGTRGNATSSSTAASAKGIKAVVDVTIDGGTISVDSSDDSLHSNGSLTINGGNPTLASGDDGMHADATLEINGGEISITKCYEGIESAVITINDGNIHLVASDDGINVAGGNDGSSIAGRPGQNNFSASANNYLHINGGYIVVEAMGDGLDVNGAIAMTGGVVIVNGPIANNNGALDYDRGFKITGGTVVAIGSAGMAQAPDTSSTQHSVMVTFPAAQPAGTIVHIAGANGEAVLTFVPTKAFQSVVLSSPQLKDGTTYTVYTGGSSTGAATDGVISGGKYTAGTQATSFTISGVVTNAGSPRSNFPAGGRR